MRGDVRTSANNGIMRRTSDLRLERAERRLTWITERVRLFRQCFEMTRHPLAASGRPKFRLLRSAAIEHIWTTCVKAASAGGIDRARPVALQDDRMAGGPGLRHRHGREQGLRVGMLRRGVDLLRGGHLDDLAEIHDYVTMRPQLDDRQIVA